MSAPSAAQTGSPPTYQWGHRAYLTGLRAPAVYLVVLFHAGVGAFEGGFIGVDLFFVLSGFLVCQVLLDEVEEHGRIRFARFYARRFRRLLPAALVAITFTSLLFVGIAPSLERADLIDDARASLLYVANWSFVADAHDYFGGGAAESPFLHFWSLSVEEQYYLVFPVLLFAIWKLVGDKRRRLLPAVLLAPAALSLIFQLTVDDPNRAYYGTDARLYQPLAGAALAAWLRTRGRPLVADSRMASRLGGVAVGLLFVVASSGLGDIPASRRGLLATFIAIEAIAALEAAPNSFAARILSSRPAQYLGDISYGTYLWHWPIILATKRLVEVNPLTAALVSTLIATALASLSTHLIEQPIRRKSILDLIPQIVISGSLTASALAAIWLAPAVLRSDHDPVLPRAEASDLAFVAPTPMPTSPPTTIPTATLAPITGPGAESTAADAPDQDQGDDGTGDGAAGDGAAEDGATAGGAIAAGKDGIGEEPEPDAAAPEAVVISDTSATSDIDPDDLDLDAAGVTQARYECAEDDPTGCVLREGTGMSIHVIGDSHAAAWIPAISALADEFDLTVSATTVGSCPWQDQLSLTHKDNRFIDLCRRLREDAYERVIPELDPDIVVVAHRAWDTPEWLGDRPGPEADGGDLDADPFTSTTDASIARFLGDGRRVIILEPLPESTDTDPLECLSGASSVDECSFMDVNRDLASERYYRELDAASRDIISLDMDVAVCPTLPVCPAVVNGEVVRSDPHHLSQPFARSLVDELLERILPTQILEP